MPRQFSGDHSQDTVRVYQTDAEAHLAIKDIKGAEPLVQASLDGARAQFGEKSPLYGNGLNLQGRLRLLQGRKAEAELLAEQASHSLSEAGDAGKYYLLQLQELRAELAGAASPAH